MRRHFHTTLSPMLAVALLTSAVMLSAGFAKGPDHRGRENAFERPPLGHSDKALIATAWVADTDQPQAAEGAFDWDLDRQVSCPRCEQESKVTPVVLDVPEPLPSDTTAIDLIKRKLGINAFRGSIFDGAEAPATQLLRRERPLELQAFDTVLKRLNATDAATDAIATTYEDEIRATGSYSPITRDDAPASIVAPAAPKTVGVGRVLRAAADTCCSEGVCSDVKIEQRETAVSLPSDRTELLRMYGPELDELANKLEEMDLYGEADAVRAAAQRIRVKARELKHGIGAALESTTLTPAAGQSRRSVGAASAGWSEPEYFQSPTGVSR
jgi:hypothetical protein